VRRTCAQTPLFPGRHPDVPRQLGSTFFTDKLASSLLMYLSGSCLTNKKNGSDMAVEPELAAPDPARQFSLSVVYTL